MTIDFIHHLIQVKKREALLEAEYKPFRAQLHRVGLILFFD